MNINYHELTMEESKDSPARKKQFVTICVLGIGALSNAMINAGVFQPIQFEEGVFPGGEFHYRMKTGDYSTCMGYQRCTTTQLRMREFEDTADFLYTIYMDDASLVDGGQTRFFSGALFNDDNDFEAKKDFLNTSTDGNDKKKKDGLDNCKNEVYEIANLPSVKAGVTHLPFTNGFVSDIIQMLKILPATLKYGKQKGISKHNLVTISTCSVPQQMCTHYVPLLDDETFLLGRPNIDKYTEVVQDEL